jgi:hypothetical protein
MKALNYIFTLVRSVYHKLYWIFNNFTLIRKFSRLIPHEIVDPITYRTDGLITITNCDFINEPKFAKAYAAAKSTNPWEGFTLQWRVYIICWLANLVKNKPGDFVECGVNTGAYARAVVEYTDFSSLNKFFYLFDTFEGFPEDQITDEERNKGLSYYGGDHYKFVYDQVVQTFAPFPVKIIKGKVPETLQKCKTKSICFLSIDMNAVYPEIESIQFFWDKIVSGGVVVLDDYGFPLHVHQKHAFDTFAEEKGIEILSLPTGQGIIFKP